MGDVFYALHFDSNPFDAYTEPKAGIKVYDYIGKAGSNVPWI